MLWRLLRKYLAPYKTQLAVVVNPKMTGVPLSSVVRRFCNDPS